MNEASGTFPEGGRGTKAECKTAKTRTKAACRREDSKSGYFQSTSVPTSDEPVLTYRVSGFLEDAFPQLFLLQATLREASKPSDAPAQHPESLDVFRRDPEPVGL